MPNDGERQGAVQRLVAVKGGIRGRGRMIVGINLRRVKTMGDRRRNPVENGAGWNAAHLTGNGCANAWNRRFGGSAAVGRSARQGSCVAFSCVGLSMARVEPCIRRYLETGRMRDLQRQRQALAWLVDTR